MWEWFTRQGPLTRLLIILTVIYVVLESLAGGDKPLPDRMEELYPPDPYKPPTRYGLGAPLKREERADYNWSFPEQPKCCERQRRETDEGIRDHHPNWIGL